MHSDISIKSKIKKYDVYFENNLKKIINQNYNDNDVILIDNKVYKKFDKNNLIKKKVIKLSINERAKEYYQIGNIINKLININFSKKNKLIVIGGGITQDISSFISHIIFRGVDWIYVPTTLLSQADSCIGSKISINFKKYKNLIGNYNPPTKIYICENFLKTIQKKDILSGIGEMLHYFIISSNKDLNNFSKNIDNFINLNNNIVNQYIKLCLNIKKKFIEKDEFDNKERIFLNYGHTFGHAIESIENYKIPHGISVCYGIDIVNYISYKLNCLSKANYLKINNIIKIITKDYPIKKLNINKLYKIILKDKKTLNGEIRLVLISAPGKPFIKQFKKNNNLKRFIIDYFRS